MLQLSIIIVNWNGLNVILDCLDSVYNNIKSIDFEVIVVDNNSSDGSPEAVEKKFPDVKLIREEKNHGFAGANNIGIKKALGKYIVLLNSDTIILDSTFKNIIEIMDSDKNIGILGPKVLNEDGSFQSSAGRFPSLMSEISGYFFLSRIPGLNIVFKDRFIREEFDEIKEVDWISGACLFLRKEIIEDVGYLDERYFMYVEDIDFCYQARKNKWKVVYYPFSKIIHLGGYSVSYASDKVFTNNIESYFKFYRKHFNIFQNLALSSIFLGGTVLRLLLFSMIFIFTWKSKFKTDILNNLRTLKAIFEIKFKKN